MPLFTNIPNSAIVMRSGGVFKQTELYKRGGFVYAKDRGGFVLLRKDGETSVPKLRWEDIECDEEHGFDRFGRMTLDMKQAMRKAA